MFASVCACAAVTEIAERPATAALLGAGVIGAGWAARLLLAGVDVRLFDPAPDAVRLLINIDFPSGRSCGLARVSPSPAGRTRFGVPPAAGTCQIPSAWPYRMVPSRSQLMPQC